MLERAELKSRYILKIMHVPDQILITIFCLYGIKGLPQLESVLCLFKDQFLNGIRFYRVLYFSIYILHAISKTDAFSLKEERNQLAIHSCF